MRRPRRAFARNAYALDEVPLRTRRGKVAFAPVVPGLSFFDRADQRDVVKLHLPYLWRTEPGVDTLFLAPLNRDAPFGVVAGLVETQWYAGCIGLVLRVPRAPAPVHVAAGDAVAHAVLVSRTLRRPAVRAVAPHERAARDERGALGEWYRDLAADRSAYKQLARRQADDA